MHPLFKKNKSYVDNSFWIYHQVYAEEKETKQGLQLEIYNSNIHSLLQLRM